MKLRFKSWNRRSGKGWMHCLLFWKRTDIPMCRHSLPPIKKAEAVVSRYNWELAEWEQTVREKKRSAERPPERQSVRDQLRRLQEEGRKTPRNRNRDYER